MGCYFRSKVINMHLPHPHSAIFESIDDNMYRQPRRQYVSHMRYVGRDLIHIDIELHIHHR